MILQFLPFVPFWITGGGGAGAVLWIGAAGHGLQDGVLGLCRQRVSLMGGGLRGSGGGRGGCLLSTRAAGWPETVFWDEADRTGAAGGI